MKLHLFGRKRNKAGKEKGHREPIIVKIFKDDSLTQVNVNDIGENDEEQTEDETFDKPVKKVKFVPNQKYFTISVYVLCVILVAILMVVVVFKISSVIEAIKSIFSVIGVFLAAAMIAFIVSPIINWLDETLLEKGLKIKNDKIKITVSIFITYVLLIGILVGGCFLVIPQIIDSIKELTAKSKVWYGEILEFFETLEDRFPTIDFTYINEQLKNFSPQLVSYATEFVKDYVPKLLSTSYGIIKAVINFLLTIAISIYMVCDKRRIAQKATQLAYVIMEPKKAPKFLSIVKESGRIFFGFIIGKALDSLIIGIITLAALSIFKFPYALLMSVVVGVTNMIPFFGPFIGAIPGILLYLCVDPVLAFIFAVIILAIQQFDGWVLGPMILGDSTGIRPIWVIFGITVGGAYFGFLGMFLGVPVTAVIVYLIDLWVNKVLRKKGIEVS